MFNSSSTEGVIYEYPKQKLLHQLNRKYLTPGEDGYYYKIRDYNLNEADLLGSGNFGSCLWAQDNTTTKIFAIKQNKNGSFKSIEDECHVLSRLADNDYIIKFLGAVIDEGELPTQPLPVCKMMMELAENGNLSEMLKDEYGEEAPLPQDQSLYYLQQILEGVNFLHQSGYLHLDIKAQNILVFDGGRTVKLTDFGTAVAVGEVTSMQGLKGLTPYFVAPELIKGEVPKFSADIWSVLCILIEMLTARYPGHHHVGTDMMAMMFLIAIYTDDMINKLVPLDRLDVDPEVKQLFIDVLQVDPLSRPTAIELLNRPIISSAVDYGRYFDECYNSEDADSEDLEASPAVECDDSIPIAEVPQHISLSSSSGGQSLSLHSLGDKVSELPQFPCSNPRQDHNRGSQDSGVGGDLESSFRSSTVFTSQMSGRSLSSGSNKSGGMADMQQQTSLALPTTSLHSMEEKLGDLSSELSLIITNAEQYLSWPEFGLSLHVAENSLSEGIEQCSVSIKTRILGDYKFPKDSHLVSAVYSVKCVPKCRFSEPVTLEIQHCAKPKNTHKLSFIRAIRSDSEQKTSLFHAVETGETPEVDGILYSCFPFNTSYGFIEISKFCQFGVIQRDTNERDYCVNVYYQENNAKKFGVYFTILWNTSTHKKVLDEHYQKKNAVCQHDQPVEFEDVQIKLDIPFPSSIGIVSEDNAWRILSLTPPVIEKKEVDSFKEGKRIPSCQLMVKCDSEQVTDLELQPVNLKGAREL